ncbi:MAG: Peptide chain release factor 2 [Candidatus Woesebacteria bacterium GW2011_GWB1_43_14]|uniref:Peptide chain release factor 2 n=1 Tax=Candidatus Woesebacteria bacterium GW2011_GWB1_43_14 TaxID=1618578 RepID=A0A0G1DHY7_9BACT|nr:MAG: Peptide chain release factor 2 [Candidatus Woesebacteria bacterium GW2011_GWA1_39_11b]KKS77512.1 MAG: peptide chain release factor 2, peptide chain release factor RF-2 [Candidatus Woesebacteria bacterium GW2011_GWC1_42_9]KKS97309.1 MAG: Peptide chain release factor 2 [Candidatus Woesebacteria bacterium GW2011_GWB1_43_14]
MNELKKKVKELSKQFMEFKKSFDIDGKKSELAILEKKALDPKIWDNQNNARRVMQEMGELKKDLEEISSMEAEISAVSSLEDVREIAKRLKKLELATYLSGEYDKKDAIVSIHAGQGGTEAMDWASMIFRMYIRYSEGRDWNVGVISETQGEEAGIKSVTFKVAGTYAYGYLKHEAGTHRLVRQSPFNADKLRQTSFVLVEVLPEIEDLDLPDIKIRDDDLKWQFYRSSGHGGQNVNKVSTAVRLTHIPTGIVITAQTERSQEQNRANALTLLRSKLWAKEQERKIKEKEKLTGEYSPATWGTQIRSYVLHPYKMVKDLRTDVETSDTDKVLDGGLAEFIEAELRHL